MYYNLFNRIDAFFCIHLAFVYLQDLANTQSKYEGFLTHGQTVSSAAFGRYLNIGIMIFGNSESVLS